MHGVACKVAYLLGQHCTKAQLVTSNMQQTRSGWEEASRPVLAVSRLPALAALHAACSHVVAAS